MAQLFIKYNPYKLETEILVNGNRIPEDSRLYGIVKEKRLQEWVSDFPESLVEEFNTLDFDIEFYGMPLDWDDLVDAFTHAQNKKTINKLNLKFIEGKSDEDINQKVVEIFEELQNGPVEDLKGKKLKKQFDDINNFVFPIHVVATMSSGKSTLINALLGEVLMPAKNEACTATITEILDNDSEKFTAVTYDENNRMLQQLSNIDNNKMKELNEDEKVYKIAIEGDIPFLDSQSTALMLVDTPGPNNSQNQTHKNITYSMINNDTNNLIIYVLNGTQLSTNDDASLLSYAAEQIAKGGKTVRDRFLFVINKMDQFKPDEGEDIESMIQTAKTYLKLHGINDPQIFPCSASLALNIRTYLQEVDINNMTMEKMITLPTEAMSSYASIVKFNKFKSMHLEQYSTLAPSAQRELEYRLKQAETKGDVKEQALIHCGIYSIEAAITAYVKKYAKTKKVKDLVETFQERLESTEVFANIKKQIAIDEQAAEACIKRAVAVKAKIADGKEAEKFKQKIEELKPIALKIIEEQSEKLENEAMSQASVIFEPYPDTLKSEDEAKRLIAQFARVSSNCTARLSAELESVIRHEVEDAAQFILNEYKNKLRKIDEDVEDKKLEFGTVDLVNGALSSMVANTDGLGFNQYAKETVDALATVTYEERVWYEKTGQKAEKVADGTKQEFIGTEKVIDNWEYKKTGTRTVRNPKKDGFLARLKFWQPNYVEEDVYESVPVYKNKDVYKTVINYKTVMKDVYEERREQIKNFSVDTAVIESRLTSTMTRNLDEGIKAAKEYAAQEIEDIQEQFKQFFDELDEIIKEKYTELEKCASDQKMREEELKKNQEILEWIEKRKAEITNILNI